MIGGGDVLSLSANDGPVVFTNVVDDDALVRDAEDRISFPRCGGGGSDGGGGNGRIGRLGLLEESSADGSDAPLGISGASGTRW